MINSLVNVTGVAIARAIPGLLSFACILLIGSRLSTSDFGLYSTFAASTNLLASIAYGPIQFSIVSSYAKAEAAGHGSSYMSTVMILSVLLSLFLWICSSFFTGNRMVLRNFLAPIGVNVWSITSTKALPSG